MDTSPEARPEAVVVTQGPLGRMRELERVLHAAGLMTAQVVAPAGGPGGG